MVEVIGSKQKQEIDGIKELEEMSNTFKELVDNVIVAVEGCENTDKLVERLFETYVAVHKLQNSIKEMNNSN